MLLITQKQGEFETALFSQIHNAGEFEESKYSPKRTKEENIIGKKEKGVSADTVLKNYWSGNEEFADLSMQYCLEAARS